MEKAPPSHADLEELRRRVTTLEHRLALLETAAALQPGVSPAEEEGAPGSCAAPGTPPSSEGKVNGGPARISPELDAAGAHVLQTNQETSRSSFEARLAIHWLSRIGIAILVGGIALLIARAVPTWGVAAKVGAGLLASVLLGGLGLYLQPRYVLFGRIMMAGGLALAYFITYSLHFIGSMRLFTSPYPVLGLLVLIVAGVVIAAQRMRSETVAGMALFLGHLTALISESTTFTLLATFVLCCGAIYFMLANRWVIVPVSSVVAVYLTHTFWVIGTLPSVGVTVRPIDSFWASAAFLVLYFSSFSIASFFAAHTISERARALIGLANNLGFLLLGARELLRHHSPALPYLALAYAAVLVVLGVLAYRRFGPVLLFHQHLLVAGLLVSVGLALVLPGTWVPDGWALTCLVAIACSWRFRVASLHVYSAALLLAAALAYVLQGGAALVTLALLSAVAVAGERSTAHLQSRRAIDRQGSRLPPALGDTLNVGYISLLALIVPWGLTRATTGVVTTLCWGGLALALFFLGLKLRQRWYRYASLALLGLVLIRITFIDLSFVATGGRIASIALLGAALLGISFLYARFENRL